MALLPALVADAGFGSSVAGIRALGGSGVSVLALGSDVLAAGRWSRFARWRAVAPLPSVDPGGFAAAVGSLGRRYGPLVAYCGAEPSVDALAAHSDTLHPGV